VERVAKRLFSNLVRERDFQTEKIGRSTFTHQRKSRGSRPKTSDGFAPLEKGEM
jgi:hypothetical protein